LSTLRALKNNNITPLFKKKSKLIKFEIRLNSCVKLFFRLNLLKRITENISENSVRTEIGKIIESSFEITKGVIDSEKFNILFDKKILFICIEHTEKKNVGARKIAKIEQEEK
jgi:ATP-dependent Clp protease ATP-binding subunit ClpA